MTTLFSEMMTPFVPAGIRRQPSWLSAPSKVMVSFSLALPLSVPLALSSTGPLMTPLTASVPSLIRFSPVCRRLLLKVTVPCIDLMSCPLPVVPAPPKV